MAKKATIKNQIRKMRNQKGWTLEELAKRYQRKRNAVKFEEDMDFIRRAEAGDNINLTDAQVIAMALGVKTNDLYPMPNKRNSAKP